MPTVLRVDGFRVVIFPPPREHGPAHVHVFNADGNVMVWLRSDHVAIRTINGMRPVDVVRAVAIVDNHAEMLRTLWRKYHG